MKQVSRNSSRIARARRVRAKVSGTAECPRLCVFRSLHGVSTQVIDDTQGRTLCAASWKDLKMKKAKNTVEEAEAVGKLIAEKCLAQDIKTIVFDRAGYRYHGKVKALAEAVRSAGIKF